MPYLSLPDEATARAIIQKKLEAINPGLAPLSVTHVVQVGGYTVEFVGNKTCTSVIVSHGVYTLLRGTVRSVWGHAELRLGKTFIRGRWEMAFGVEPLRYCADSSDPLPEGLIGQVRDVVDGRREADDVLERLQGAMDGLGEYVECIQRRSDGGSAMIDIICNGFSDAFLVALAVVLRFAGARSTDVQCIFDFAEKHGANPWAVLSELLDTADRIAKFTTLMAIAPDDEQVALVRQTVEHHRDLLGWIGRHLQNEDSAREFYDRLATAFQRQGLELAPTEPDWSNVFHGY